MAARSKMGWQATWSMAVGGMIGGGIFSVLGVVVEQAGHLAWASFLLAGMVALATADSYVRLAGRFGEAGGAFSYLRGFGHPALAGSLSWVLIAGYILTISVYAFTFAHYVGVAVGFPDVAVRLVAVAAVAILVAVNLAGVGEASFLEIILVWGKLAILVGLAAIGLTQWQPHSFGSGAAQAAPAGVVIGAASVFMAYEGFQLLTYDYDEIRDPTRTLRNALLPAVITVTAVYIVVMLGAYALVGPQTLIREKEVALAIAGRAALGTLGLVIVTAGAAFSTMSAINATLFATARLSRTVAEQEDLPSALARSNSRGVPSRAVIMLGAASAALATFGSLSGLVETASLAFLITFSLVNAMAARRLASRRWVSWPAAIAASAAALILLVRLVLQRPITVAVLAMLVVIASVARPLLHRASGRTS